MAHDDHAMATDSDAQEGDTQQSTQQTQAANTQTPQSQVDSHLWGFLQPCNVNVPRIDFFRQSITYKIGRNKSNDVQLQGMKVSGAHCTFTWDERDARDSVVTLTDLSSNGTWVRLTLVYTCIRLTNLNDASR